MATSVKLYLMLFPCVPLSLFGMPTYKIKQAPIDERVNDLLARMTLEEKVAQMRHPWTHGNNTGWRLRAFRNGAFSY